MIRAKDKDYTKNSGDCNLCDRGYKYFGKLGLSSIIIVLCVSCFGQSKTELEKKKYKALQEIEFANKLLNETEKNKKQTFQKLQLINFQIESRKGLIREMEEDISNLSKNIEEYDGIAKSLEEDLEIIKIEYLRVLRYSSVVKKRKILLINIICSESVSQAYQRYLYAKRYFRYRKSQWSLIQNVKEEIEEKRERIKNLKSLKELSVSEKEKENKSLTQQLKEKNSYINILKRKERELKEKLRISERIAKQLQNEIDKILEEERKKALNKKEFTLTPEDRIIAGDFEKNKGKLLWPTEKGIIFGKYGEHEHPVLKNVKIRNNGVDIATETNGNVRAVFDGTVSKVVAIMGANYTVIVRHGMFLTVYQNLVDIKVKAGEKITRKQILGRVNDGSGSEQSILHLEIWKNFDRMNPEEWLAK